MDAPCGEGMSLLRCPCAPPLGGAAGIGGGTHGCRPTGKIAKYALGRWRRGMRIAASLRSSQ